MLQLKHRNGPVEIRRIRNGRSLYPDNDSIASSKGITTMPYTAPQHRNRRDMPGLQMPKLADPRRRSGFGVSRAPRTTLDQMMAMEMA